MAKKKDSKVVVVRGGAPDEDDITEGMSTFQLADLYGKLYEHREKLLCDPVFTRFAEVEAKLKARIERDHEPEDTIEVRGKQYTVKFGPAARAARTVKSIKEAFKVMGETLFFQLAKINVTDIERHLTAAQAAKLILPGKGFIDRREIEVARREKPTAKE